MTSIRHLLLDALLIAIAIVGIRRVVVQPYRWNAEYPELIRRYGLAEVEARTSFDGARPRARELLDTVNRDPSWGLNANYQLLRADVLRLLERDDEAIATYVDALRFDRRPEIYTPLGLLQVRTGKRAAGIDNLVTALRFNPMYANQIDRPDVAEEVSARLREGLRPR